VQKPEGLGKNWFLCTPDASQLLRHFLPRKGRLRVMQFIIADTLKPQFKSVSNAMTHTKQVIAHTKHKGDVARIVPFSVGMHFFSWRMAMRQQRTP
jgi:hypothetical protein